MYGHPRGVQEWARHWRAALAADRRARWRAFLAGALAGALAAAAAWYVVGHGCG